MNKSKLLASTVLVSAATMMAAGPVSAAKLSLGGYFEQWIGWADADNLSGLQNKLDIKQDSEIYFSFKEKLDNGLTVGGRMEMEAGVGNNDGISAANDAAPNSGNTQGAGFDEASVYVSGSFGKVQLGNNDVAAAYTGGISVVGPVGHIKSDAGDWLYYGSAMNNTDLDLGIGDAGNITYWTPKIGGLQLIASYTPDSSDSLIGDYDAGETAGAHNHVSMSLQYNGKVDGGKFKIAGGLSTVENTDASGDDQEYGFNVAADVSMGSFRVTAAYAHEYDTNDDDIFWGIGVRYKLDKVNEISVGYGNSETQAGTGGTDETTKLYTLGYNRNMGKGVNFAASLFKTDHDDSTAAGAQTGRNRDVNDFGIVGGIRVNF